MKRKTNLFYTAGPDSKFITFSNYTEALTGNYLSVNTKLFPDNFLCLSIKGLNSTSKEIFIKYLVSYYENKLAVIRDHNINETTETIEKNIYPLAYLLEAILKVVSYDNGEYSLNIENGELIINDDNFNLSEISNLITYIGQITETDYYGTYTDIICNINCEDYVEGTLKIDSDNISYNELTVSVDNTEKLYGWENDEIFDTYKQVHPIYDINNTYIKNSKLSQLVLHKIDNNSTNNKTLKFNVIIPLFSYVNIDVNYSNYKNNIKLDEDTQNHYILLNSENKHCVDVPLGMWINADNENDTFIELIKDQNMNLYPNWSLLISTQFKPFPYSTKLTKDNEVQNSIGNSYATFAEVLSKMNLILDKFNYYNDQIVKLNNAVDDINTQLKNIGTTANIQKINEAVLGIESSVNNQINGFKQQLYGYLQNLKWTQGEK